MLSHLTIDIWEKINSNAAFFLQNFPSINGCHRKILKKKRILKHEFPPKYLLS
jgi:hypothetical protein